MTRLIVVMLLGFTLMFIVIPVKKKTEETMQFYWPRSLILDEIIEI
jgi:hypothetical protein